MKNVVLVHGGFVDGTGWEGVYAILKKGGYNVSIIGRLSTWASTIGSKVKSSSAPMP